MSARRFHYLSPKLYPVLPAQCGVLHFGVNLQKALDTRAVEPFDGVLQTRLSLFCEGEAVREEVIETRVAGGRCDGGPIWREVSTPAPGYVEIAITADKPIFSRLLSEPGYAVLAHADYGVLTANSDHKYADPRVIDQLKFTPRYTLLHSAALVERARDSAESFLMINPYQRPIVVRLVSDLGRRATAKVAPRSAALVPLAELLDDGRFGTVMLTANNRLACYDVRHRYDPPLRPNRIDHLDVFNGLPTHERVPLQSRVRAAARRGLRALGLRAS